MKATKQIDIYLTRKRNVRLIDVVQYDTGIQLVFTLKDFTIPSGATATLYVQKPSGKFVFQEGGVTIAGNTITIDLENQAITEHGKVPYQVSITSGSDVITTFTGVMMVEKSLKDAGATESKTVIRAFDEVLSDHVAEFQTKAEQIVQACIATIPDDYPTMEAKVNELANAVKGYLSGAVVAADDVSPVEHSPVVKVRSKNHFNPNDYRTEKDHSNGRTIYAISADNLVIGRTYTVFSSVPMGWFKISNSATGYSCVGTTNYVNGFSSFTFTHNRNANIHKDDYLFIYVQNLEQEAMYNLDVLKSMNVCIVEGSYTAEYTPYIDPSTAMVTRCGKNLSKQSHISVTGTVATNGSIGGFHGGILARDLRVQPGATYSVSMNKPNEVTNPCLFFYNGNLSASSITHTACYLELVSGGRGEQVSALNGAVTNINNFEYMAVTIGNESNYAENTEISLSITNLQIEAGENATAFEPYSGAEYVPTADGTVPGITSLSPSMTILTDTEGVIVECEYNRDTNKVIDKLVNAIIALGGTV